MQAACKLSKRQVHLLLCLFHWIPQESRKELNGFPKVSETNIFYHRASETQSSYSKEEKNTATVLLSEVDTQMWLNVHVLYNVLYKVSGIQDFRTMQTVSASPFLAHQFFKYFTIVYWVVEYKLYLRLLHHWIQWIWSQYQLNYSEYNRGCSLTTATENSHMKSN